MTDNDDDLLVHQKRMLAFIQQKRKEMVMPHKQGYNKATIAHNIKHMIRAGHPRKQAIAAAYSTARRVAKKAGVKPAHIKK